MRSHAGAAGSSAVTPGSMRSIYIDGRKEDPVHAENELAVRGEKLRSGRVPGKGTGVEQGAPGAGAAVQCVQIPLQAVENDGV